MKKLAAALGLCIGMLAGAQAAPVTYHFTVTAESGALSGMTSSGHFSFDDSIIPAGGGFVAQVGLLTDLSFTWNSVAYDETTANTGILRFASDGALHTAMFGTNCSAGGCSASSYIPNSWYVASSSFTYEAERSLGFGTASLRATSVAEPGALALLGLGIAGIAGLRRKH